MMRSGGYPTSLAEFDRWIRDLNAPETGPPAENLISNEDSTTRVCDRIDSPLSPESAYLGVGPEQNLTLLAHARPELAFIVDYRRRNLLVHLLHKALMVGASDRVTYLERLTARRPERRPGVRAGAAELVAAFREARYSPAVLEEAIAHVARTLEPLGLLTSDDRAELARIHAKLARPGVDARFLALREYPTLGSMIETEDRAGRAAHYLASDELYRHVAGLQARHRIIPIVGDYLSDQGLAGVSRSLRRLGLTVRLIYASDMEWFVLRARKLGAFQANLGLLPTDERTQVIRTATRLLEKHPARVGSDHCTTVIAPLSGLLSLPSDAADDVYDTLFRTI